MTEEIVSGIWAFAVILTLLIFLTYIVACIGALFDLTSNSREIPPEDASETHRIEP